MNKIIATGKTIEDAVQSGLAQWNMTKEKVEIHIIEQPVKGLFGFIGAKAAKVELVRIPDPLEVAIQFLDDILKSMQLEVLIEVQREQGGIILNLSGSELGILIGRRGQTLDSLQYLVNIVANRVSDTHLRITLDAENFRERRMKTLEELSIRLAGRVIRTKKEVILEPMPPQERKVIHFQLQNHVKVKTYSKGEDPNRRVVITLR